MEILRALSRDRTLDKLDKLFLTERVVGYRSNENKESIDLLRPVKPYIQEQRELLGQK